MQFTYEDLIYLNEPVGQNSGLTRNCAADFHKATNST